MVSKRTAERLIKAWRKHNESPSTVQPKEFAYTDVWLQVDQDGVYDPRPGAMSWKMDEDGNVVQDHRK